MLTLAIGSATVVLDCLIDLLRLILPKLLHPTLDDRVCLGVGLRIRLEALACVS